MTRKHYGIRDKRYKLIHWYGKGELNDKDIDSWELYDLKKDPTEINNVYNDKKYTKVKEQLHTLLEQKRKDLKVTE